MKFISSLLLIIFLAGCTSELEFEYQKKLSSARNVPEAIDLVWDVVNTNPDESRRRLAWLWDKSVTDLPNGRIFNDPCVRSTIVSIAVGDNVEYMEQSFYIKKQAKENQDKRVQICLMDAMAMLADDESILYLAEKATEADLQLRERALYNLRLIDKNGNDFQRQQLVHFTSRFNVDLYGEIEDIH